MTSQTTALSSLFAGDAFKGAAYVAAAAVVATGLVFAAEQAVTKMTTVERDCTIEKSDIKFYTTGKGNGKQTAQTNIIKTAQCGDLVNRNSRFFKNGATPYAETYCGLLPGNTYRLTTHYNLLGSINHFADTEVSKIGALVNSSPTSELPYRFMCLKAS